MHVLAEQRAGDEDGLQDRDSELETLSWHIAGGRYVKLSHVI